MSAQDHGFEINEADPFALSEVAEVFPDQHLVAKIKSEALIRAGFSTEDQDGNVHANVQQLQFAVLQNMQDRHVVTSKRDLGTRAATQFELYSEMLPDAPGVQALPRSLEEDVAQRDLTKLLWTYVNVGPTGFVQKHSAGLGLVLCEASVARTKVHEETGKRQPSTERARFLTADGELIMTYYTGPAGAGFVRAARKLDAQLGLVRERRPELAVPVARQLSAVVKQAVTSIPHADPKQINALTAGSNEDADGA